MNMVKKLEDRLRHDSEERDQRALALQVTESAAVRLYLEQSTTNPARRSRRDEERLAQGAGAIFSPRRAAELLPGDDKVNREWLRSEGLVHKSPTGGDIVIWSEVQERLGDPSKTKDSKPVTDPRPPKTTLPRFDLDQ